MAAPKGKVVSYTYVKPLNQKHLLKMAHSTGHTLSECMDAILDSVRLKRPIRLKTKAKPKYIQHAEKVSAKKAKKMKALTKKAKAALKETPKKAAKKATTKKTAVKKVAVKTATAKKAAPLKVKKPKVAKKVARKVKSAKLVNTQATA